VIVAVSSAPVYDKSDVVARLASMHGLEIVADPAPALCDAFGFQTLYEMPADLQRACREQLLRDHLSFVQSHDDVVFGFSAVEWLADWMRWFWGTTPTESWAGILALGGEAARRYGSIYHVVAGPRRAYDGYAWLDAENSRQVNSLIGYLHGELGVADIVRAG
jgi:hypothetical protein